CVERCVAADRASKLELLGGDIDGDDSGTERSGNHEREESDAAATMHCDPLSFRDARLVHYRAKRGGKTTTQARGGFETQLIRHANQIEICATNRDVLCE